MNHKSAAAQSIAAPGLPTSSSTTSRTLWLALGLLRRDLQDRYAGTAWGFIWAIVQPLLMLGLYAFVFAWVFRIRLPGAEGPMAYVVFVAIALWPWFMFQDALHRSMGALRSQATLIRKTAMPRDLPVLVACASTLLIHGIGYVLVLIALALAGADLQLRGVPLLALTLLSLAALVTATGWLASLCQLIWRDLEQAIQPLLMILFYATPILYPLTLVPAEMRDIVAANPFAWIAGRLRDALLSGALPRLNDIALFAVALGVLWLVRRVYLRVARQAEDLL